MDDVFVTAVKNQWRSLLAMLMAEYASRVSKNSLGLFEEIFGLVVIGGSMLLLRFVTRGPTHHGMPVVPFVLSGIILFWMMRTTVFRIWSFKGAKAAFRTNPRVTALDVLFAKATLNVSFYLAVGFPLFIILHIFGLSPLMDSPGTVFFLMCLMGVWAFGLGLCFGALFVYLPFAKLIITGMMMAAMWVSGIMFIWPETPYMLRPILIYNPIFHFMELMRSAYFSAYVTQMGSWIYVLSIVGVTLALGLMLERIVRRKVESSPQRQGAEDDAFETGAL